MRQTGSSREGRQACSLDESRLESLALRYVGRYATTRAKLRDYLLRKIDGAVWNGDAPADADAIVDRIAALGYVDDRVFAGQRAAALVRRGFGARRIGMALRVAGIAREDGAEALADAQASAFAAALAFARRKRAGPFCEGPTDRSAREKALAAFVRAGHDPALARRILACAPGEMPEE